MSVLSIFVDESGDFGTRSDYYVVSLVFHNQKDDISSAVSKLTEELKLAGLDYEHAIHTGAAIRGEDEYRGTPVADRKREFTRLRAFAFKVPAVYKSFVFMKKEFPPRWKLKGAISRSLSTFLHDNTEFLLSFDKVVVYYDNGQAEITDVLNTLLNAFFFDVEIRRVTPVDYRLFQVADLYCTLELLRAKSADNRLSKSDLYFFGSKRLLNKNFLAKLDRKQFHTRH
jgi:hypothetical protein